MSVEPLTDRSPHERSEMRGGEPPDFASLHPGYGGYGDMTRAAY